MFFEEGKVLYFNGFKELCFLRGVKIVLKLKGVLLCFVEFVVSIVS